MAAFSQYLQNKVLDAELRGQAFTFPATVYVALFTVAQTASGTGGTEVSGGAYARVADASSLTNWSGTQGAGTTAVSSGTSGQISNNTAINFPTPTASWGTVVGFAVYDAATAGNLLLFGTLAQSQTISSGNTVSFPAGSLTDSIA